VRLVRAAEAHRPGAVDGLYLKDGDASMIHYDRGVEASGKFRIRTEPLQETVYRYRAINEWLKPILMQDELYFATPEACNDPFDCRFEVSLDDPVQGLRQFLDEQRTVSQLMQMADQWSEGPMPAELAPSRRLATMTDEELSAYTEQVYEQFGFGDPAKQQELKSTLEQARNRIGICCFAGRGDSLLMHAHYAAQHSGCCLQFQIRDHEGNRQSIFEEPDFGFRDVIYEDSPPAVRLYEMGTIESICKVTLTKHSRWAYEEEVRVVRFKGPGVSRYRREALTGLIFGCKTPTKDVDLVLGWLGERPSVELLRAVPKSDATLSVVPL